jgi:hypothetical protein
MSIAAVLLSVSLPASAEGERTVEGARVHLRDVSDGFEGEIAELDLGAAPPPGNTRTLPRAEVEAQIRAAGGDSAKLRMPRSLLIRSASRRWSAQEIEDMFEPPLTAALPRGVTLRQVKYSHSLVTSPKITVGDARIPKLPKHAGELTVTATVDLRQEDAVVARIPVTVVVDIGLEATRPMMEKGARVTVVIDHGGARVSAVALSMSNADLGEVILFRVTSTQRVLRGRVASSDTADVVEQ